MSETTTEAPSATPGRVILGFNYAQVNASGMGDDRVRGRLAGEGGVFSLVAGEGPSHGRVFIASDGRFAYEPNDSWTGSDSFRFAVTDAEGRVSIATMTVLVDPTLRGPIEGSAGGDILVAEMTDEDLILRGNAGDDVLRGAGSATHATRL